MAAVSDLVLENYANANLIWRDGPIDGSRRLRMRYRQSAAKLNAIGIPPSRIGIMIGFQTGAGAGGREGLQPRSRWFSVAKWQALAVRQVASELRLSHVWSWGWAQRNERSNDPDKTFAACVWLWARDASLCDAPAILGDELDADMRTGQLNLPGGTRCVYGTTPITASGVAALAKVTQDRELALTALVVRAIERERTRVSPSDTLALERRIVGTRFGGSASAFRTALAEAGASLAVGRGIIGDELRSRDDPRPPFASLRSRHGTSRDSGRRSRRSSRARSSSHRRRAGSRRGEASRLRRPRRMCRLPCADGTHHDRPDSRGDVHDRGPRRHDGARGAFGHRARPAIRRELRAERRADAYAAWTIRMQKAAESKLVCERDRLPELGVVSLSAYAPFLSLHEPEAARWRASRS